MARTYNKSGSKAKTPAVRPAEKKTVPAPETVVTESVVKEEKPARPKSANTKPKQTSAPTSKPAGSIVYQPSSQILTRAVDPSETFAIGDDMPIYYL